MLEEEAKERDRRKGHSRINARKLEELKDGTLKSAKPRSNMAEIKEEERTHLRDVWIESRSQHGIPKRTDTC